MKPRPKVCSNLAGRRNDPEHGFALRAHGIPTAYSPANDPENRRVRNVYDLAGQKLQEIRADASPLQQIYAERSYTPNGKEACNTGTLYLFPPPLLAALYSRRG